MRKRSHQHSLFATRPALQGPGPIASLPSWPPADEGFFDPVPFYRGPEIYGENAWPQAQGLGQMDPSYHKSTPLDLELYGQRLAAQAPTPALSTVSSVTYSSSGVSQPSSAGSGTSPTQTEMPYDWPVPRSRNWSRGPSPTQKTERAQSRFVCLGPNCDEAFDRDTDLELHFETFHKHKCSWAGCEQLGFASKDGLAWHVKLEHLLICPAPGCTESSFPSKRMLESHVRCAHPNAGEGKLNAVSIVQAPMAPVIVSSSSSQGSAVIRKDTTEDRAIKQVLSVAVSKKKCQEQLRAAVEKKYRRQNGMSLHSIWPCFL